MAEEITGPQCHETRERQEQRRRAHDGVIIPLAATAMADASQLGGILLQLRLKRIGLPIDDFGTGYLSLSALAQMPFSEVKIDRLFVTNRRCDGEMLRIVRGSIALAHGYGMKVASDGIDDIMTAEVLSQLECDFGQGDAFAPGLDIDALGAYFENLSCGSALDQAALIH